MQLDDVGAVHVANVALRYICSLEVTASVGLLKKNFAKAR